MFSDPVKIIEKLPIVAGSQVADLGAGSGAYVFPISKKLKTESGGKVYAIDVQKDVVGSLANRIKDEKIDNVLAVWGDIEKIGGTRLADSSIDVAIIANTLFQSEDKNGLAKEANRILKSDGYLLVVDWTDSYSGMGPNTEHLFQKEQATSLFTSSGFITDRDVPAGEHHYGILFKKVEKNI